jgi:hypothetical protein
VLEPLGTREVRRLVARVLTDGTVSFTGHAMDELGKDGLTTADAVAVLRKGIVGPGEWENGSWRYRIRTGVATVVVAFRSETRLVVVTAWRSR